MTDKELKKHVAAIHISNRLSLLQRKAANVLLLNAYDELLTKDVHKIRLTDLACIIGFGSHNLEVLKEALRGLMRTVLEWNLLDEQGRENGWEGCSMLASARIQSGFCYYSYSQNLREKLYNPEIYACINLSIQRSFSSGYALALYENCVRFRNTHSTGWINLDVYRQLMGVPDNLYQDFKRFSSRVIRDPVKQINNSSDICLEAEFKREKRRVTAVRFKIRNHPELSLPDESSRDSKALVETTPPTALAECDILHRRLLDLGLNQTQADRIIAQHEPDYITGNLAVIERDYQAGKVENLPAYTLSALERDYRPKVVPFEALQQERQQAARSAAEASRQARTVLETLHKEFDQQRLQQALNHLPPPEQERLNTAFHAHYRGNPIFEKWAPAGPEHLVIRSLFRAFASNVLLQEPTEADWIAYVAARGYDLAALQRVAASG